MCCARADIPIVVGRGVIDVERARAKGTVIAITTAKSRRS